MCLDVCEVYNYENVTYQIVSLPSSSTTVSCVALTSSSCNYSILLLSMLITKSKNNTNHLPMINTSSAPTVWFQQDILLSKESIHVYQSIFIKIIKKKINTMQQKNSVPLTINK